MSRITIPKGLQEAFGATQKRAELWTILGFGVLSTSALLVLDHSRFGAVAWWRAALAVVLIFDVMAGCVANFTRGTNAFYASRPRARWVFLAIHFHLPLVALLLGATVWPALLVWAYTILGAAVVNLLAGSGRQRFAGGLLLSIGLCLVALLPLPAPAILLVSQAFLFKVLFGFAVDHYPPSASSMAG